MYVSPNTNIPASKTCVVAICLGRNPVRDVQKARELFEFLQKQKYHEVLILVCDEIHRFEQSISRTISDSKALRRALREGDEFLRILKEAVTGSGLNVTFIRWKDMKDEKYTEQLSVLYKHIGLFKEDLNASSGHYIENRVSPGLLVTQEHLDKFNDYTVHELPIQLAGVRYNGIEYTDILHPVYVRDANQAENYHSPIADIKQKILNDVTIMRDFGPVPKVNLHRLYWTI